MRTVNILSALAIIVCCGPLFADEGAKPKKRIVQVLSSENGDYVVRAKRGDGKNENAFATVFKFEPTSRTYVRVKRLRLFNPLFPQSTSVTNSGRYIVTLDDRHKSVDSENAVVIYDLLKNKHKRFKVDDFMPKEIKERLLGHAMGVRLWYSTWPKLDNSTLELHIPADEYLNNPYVVVDIANMKVAIKDKDSPAEQSTRGEGDGLRGYARENFWLERNVAREETRRPKVDVGSVWPDTTLLFRVEPGAKDLKAMLLMFQYDEEAREYNKLHDINLKNQVAPEFVNATKDGRYLITLDEIARIGTTDNAIVIYDLLDGKSKAFALEDFMSQEDIAKLPRLRNVRRWRYLTGGNDTEFDEENLKFYPSDPKRSIIDQSRYPMVVVDIANMKVYLEKPFDPKPPK